MTNCHQVSTKAKAIFVHRLIVMTSGEHKQDVIIVDATATVPLTLEENADHAGQKTVVCPETYNNHNRF